MINAVIKYKDNKISIYNEPTESVGTQFEPGFYNAQRDQNGQLVINSSSLGELHTPFKTDENENIFKYIEGFFRKDSRQIVNNLGYIHKLGILMHGQQGTGKTAIMNYISNEMITERDSIVFFCDNGNSLTTAIELAEAIREIQDNPIIFLADEFDRYVTSYDNEAMIKDFLDGKKSVDNSLILAATNYIDEIPDSISDRPSRFRYVIEVKGIKTKREVSNIVSSIVKKAKNKKLSVKKICDNIELPATLDYIKAAIIDEALSIDLPREKQDDRSQIGFKSISDKKEKADKLEKAIEDMSLKLFKSPLIKVSNKLGVNNK